MAAPPGPRSAPPGRPDPRARRIIDQIRAYVAAQPGVRTAHGMRAIAHEAMGQADVAIVDAKDGGATWDEIGSALGLRPGGVNQARGRVERRRAAGDLQEAG